MDCPHAFRLLIIDDAWTDEDGLNHVARLTKDLLNLTPSYSQETGSANTVLTITSGTRRRLSSGWIPGDYPRKALDDSPQRGLRWNYDETQTPAGLEGIKHGEQTSLELKWGQASHPAGFWISIDSAGDEGIPYKGRVEVFVLSFWPFDRLHDLIGAREGWSRFWNVLVLDDVILKRHLIGCTLMWATDARDPFGNDLELHLFASFRSPHSDIDGDVRWLPDRRTQAIIEASLATPSTEVMPGRKLWPRFELNKHLVDRGKVDAAVKTYSTYQECIDAQPKGIRWNEFIQSLTKLAQSLNLWHSPRIDALKDPDGLIETIAATDYPVMFLGGPGTGKSFLAETIHKMSSRAGESFIEVNCATLPREGNFFESTVFGMAKAALESKAAAKKGLLANADGGTLFLDEIHHLPRHLQGALLTFLDNGKYRPLHGAECKANIRVIAATNERDAARRAYTEEDGSLLRADFFQRLSFHSIKLEPLSKRSEAEFLEICHDVLAQVKEEMTAGTVHGEVVAVPPLVHMDPSIVQHINNIEVKPATFLNLRQKILKDDDWRTQFDLGGNIRLLKQLVSKTILRNLGQVEITLEHIQKAFQIEGLHKNTNLPSAGSSLSDVSEVERAIARLASSIGDIHDTFGVEDTGGDFSRVLHILALWCLPGEILDGRKPAFDKWITAPHTLRFVSGSNQLAGAKVGKNSKWHVLVVLALLRYLHEWHITSWVKDKELQEKIGRICSDRSISDGDQSVNHYIGEALKILGYSPPKAGKEFLKSVLKVWTPDGSGNSLTFAPGHKALQAYTAALVHKLASDVPISVWRGRAGGSPV